MLHVVCTMSFSILVSSWKKKSPSQVTKYSVWTWEIKTARPLFQPLSSGNLKYRTCLSFSISWTIFELFIICSFVRSIFHNAFFAKWRVFYLTFSWTIIGDNNRYDRVIFANTLNQSIQTSVSSISFDDNRNFFVDVPWCLWCITCLNENSK